jgi:UDP-3-O-[3-hydroxymyristoyl] glucosamine N-acyltransferase
VVATVEELAALVRGRLSGDGSVSIHSARPVGEAGPGDITFIENERYAKMLRTSPASAAIVGPHFQRSGASPTIVTIEVDDPIQAFLAVRSHLGAAEKPRWSGIHPQAWVAPSARIGKDVAIYPFVYVGDEAVIGDGATLYPGAVIGDRCRLGKETVVHPNAVLYREVTLGDRVEVHAGTVLGSDGFGYRLIDGRHVKVPQTGRVEIGDDVEIGACTTIDRATFGTTRVGDGTKIDNLVQIAHNCQIGRHNIFASQVGIAGSVTTGDYVVLAGQVGVADHCRIGDRVMLGAKSGVHNDIGPDQKMLGAPATPLVDQLRILSSLDKLPEIRKDIRELKKLLRPANPE